MQPRHENNEPMLLLLDSVCDIAIELCYVGGMRHTPVYADAW